MTGRNRGVTPPKDRKACPRKAFPVNRNVATLIFFFCTLVEAFGVQSIARAAAVTTAQRSNTSASPVQVSKCTAFYSTNLGIATIESGANFENVGSKSITDLLFKFSLYDPFDDRIGDYYKMVHGTFSPGVSIQHTQPVAGWSIPPWETPIGEVRTGLNGARAIRFATDAPLIGRVDCSVVAARFSDGTIWKEAGFVAP